MTIINIIKYFSGKSFIFLNNFLEQEIPKKIWKLSKC